MVKARSLGRDQWLAGLLLASVPGAIVLGIAWMLMIETPFNGGLKETVAWLWLPLLVPVVGVVLLVRPYSLGVWVIAMVTYPMLLLMLWPHVQAINASGDHGVVVYEGRVIRRWTTGRRNNSHVLVVRDASTGAVKMHVSGEFFAKAAGSALVRCEFRRGRLGMPYRWRKGDGLKACALAA